MGSVSDYTLIVSSILYVNSIILKYTVNNLSASVMFKKQIQQYSNDFFWEIN